MKPSDTNASPSVPRPRRRRWLRVGLGVLTVAMIGALVLWQMRLAITNHFIKGAVPGYAVTAGAVDWSEGGIVVENVLVRRSQNEPPLLQLASAHLDVHPLGGAQTRWGVLTLDNPKIILTQEFWKQPPPGSPEELPSDGGSIALQGIRLRQGEVEMKFPNGETLAARLDWQGGALMRDSAGEISAGRQVISVSDIHAGLAGEASVKTDGPATMEFSLSANDRTLTIHSLKTGAVSARLTQVFLDFLKATKSEDESEIPISRPMVERVVIDDGQIGPLALTCASVPGWPALPGFNLSIQASLHQFAYTLSGTPDAGSVRVSISDLHWGNPAEPAWLELPSMEMEATAMSGGGMKLSAFDLKPTAINFSRDQARVLGLPLAFAARGTIAAHCGGLVWRAGKIAEEGNHGVEMNDVHLQLSADPGREAMQWRQLSLKGTIADVMERQHFAKLYWDAPECLVTGEDLRLVSPSRQAPLEQPQGPPETPAWYGWTCGDVTVTDASVALSELGSDIPNMATKWGAVTSNGNVVFNLAGLSVSTPGQPLAPPMVASKHLQLEINQDRLWSERRLERLSLHGARVRIGAVAEDAGTDVGAEQENEVASNPTPTPEPEVVFDPELVLPPSGWHIGSLDLQNTKIFLHHLVPDAPEIQIPVALKSFRDVPLTEEGWRQSWKSERVELPFVYVPGTRAGTSVADLDTNFIHFSFAGLMRREIDFVELVNPKIYAGDSLFHYVDKIRTQAAEQDEPKMPVTISEVRALLGSLVGLLEGEPVLSPLEPTWKISRVKAVNGQIVTTIKDSPVLRVPPLPFGADSSLRDGKIQAELAVPPGLYKPLLGLDLVTAISEGNIVFNLPLKQKDNNLVQVFRADWLRYKQFRISNVVLQVTYDKNGIYAKFWAKAYQGDLEGAFNLYLDDTLSWDMWLSGTGIETKDLTSALTPDYFSMGGKLDGKIIAQGDKTALYQATGDFKNRQEGRIKVVAVDDAIKALPEEWGQAQRAWTGKFLEVLRDFSYDTFTGRLRFYGLEGSAAVNLKGPDGERNFELYSHDRRLSASKPEPP